VRRSLFLILTIVVLSACKKPYTPELVSSPDSFLVIEGIINSGSDSTIIRLSRTTPVDAKTSVSPEKNATAIVESDDNASYPLTEGSDGTYSSAGLNLNSSKKYRLRVTTANKDVYLSDFEEVRVTPPIDSIGYQITGNGLQIYSNAHDATNNTRYYRFEYEEAWKFNTAYKSGYIVEGDKIVARKIDVYYCYANRKSSNIVIGSTIKLSQDVLHEQPITSIASNSEKVGNRYTILLKQYALSKKAYEFWQQIKNNTESLGSIFDPQPSESSGNIKCVSNPEKKAIGYISVGTVQTKRVYIDRSELPKTWMVDYGCERDTTRFEYDGIRIFFNNPPLVIPIDKAINANGAWIGYLSSSPECTDCTTRGKLQKPAFWKDK